MKRFLGTIVTSILGASFLDDSVRLDKPASKRADTFTPRYEGSWRKSNTKFSGKQYQPSGCCRDLFLELKAHGHRGINKLANAPKRGNKRIARRSLRAVLCSGWLGQLSDSDVRGKRVLEVGALDINGSVQPYIRSLEPS